MLSVIIHSRYSEATMLWEKQLLDHGSILLGPLVLEARPYSFELLSVQRDRTVSRRSKPSSCNAFIGEQPNPWNLFQLQDAISRHRGAKQFR